MVELTEIVNLDDLRLFQGMDEPKEITYCPQNENEFIEKMSEAAPSEATHFTRGKARETYAKGLVVVESTFPVQFYRSNQKAK